MSGIVGRDKGSLAAAVDECPVLGGLEVVVVRAESVVSAQFSR
jgi:hypothetical protein